MKRKTLLLFELFLVIFAIFALLNYPGYQKFLIALPCLVGALMTDKQASRVAERDAGEYVQGNSRASLRDNVIHGNIRLGIIAHGAQTSVLEPPQAAFSHTSPPKNWGLLRSISVRIPMIPIHPNYVNG